MATAGEQTIPDNFGEFCGKFRVRLKERWRHPRAFEIWPTCLRMDGVSRDELVEFQQKRLRSLLAHVAEHVPFYQRWAKAAGWRRGDAIRLEDLPTVSKVDYRADLSAFQSTAYPPSMIDYDRTSGSTGEPFRFCGLKGSYDENYCIQWRGMARFGLRPSDRRVLVWGRNPQYGASRMRKGWSRFKTRTRDWFNDAMLIDAHHVDERSAGAAVEQIERFGPAYIHGYVTPVYVLARHLVDAGRRIGGIKAVVTDSEKLYDFQREAMEKAFGCPVLEQYGCLEVGMIAARDPRGVMRINEDHILVERLEGGEAVLTNLTKQGCPFIRYNNGDLIECDEQVAEGLPYRSLKSVTGRAVDRIPIANGGFVHGFMLAYAVSAHAAYVHRYQIHQLALDEFKVRCVVISPLPADIRERIVRNFRRVAGENARVEIEEVDQIPTEKSGKFRWVISDVAKAAQAGPSSGTKG